MVPGAEASCPACGEPRGPAGKVTCAACGADLQPVDLCMALARGALRAARRALRLGCFRAALDHLDQAAALRPPDGEGRLLRGLALLGAGRPRAAAPYLAGTPVGERLLAAAADLRDAEARYGAARRLALAGDLDGALRALAAGPATSDGLVLYALCSLQGGDRAGAEAALHLALRADPSHGHAAALLSAIITSRSM